MTRRLALAWPLACLALLASSSRPAAAGPPPTRVTVVQELVDLLALPNVAADQDNIRRNAEHLESLLARRGFHTELLETAGNPLIWGELPAPGATRTLLVYCHYDGQPVDPARWQQASPFTAILRRGKLEDGAAEVNLDGLSEVAADWRLYARSASDDKGPIVALLAAIDALAAAGTPRTSNLKVILDGEEEAGSPSLVGAISRYRDQLAADGMLILDGPEHPSGRPTLVFGARGILTARLTVFGPKVGVHSGNYGNWVPNPALALVQLLAAMKDDKGEVVIPGFYATTPALTAEERALLAAIPDQTPQLLAEFGIAAPERPGMKLEEAFVRPTLNIRGLASAHVGAGARTIIPDRAVAELDIRMVAGNTAADFQAKLRAFVASQGFQLVDGEPTDAARARFPKLASLSFGAGSPAFSTSPALPFSLGLRQALAARWGEPPVVLLTAGGTVPIAPFVEALQVPAVLVPIVNFDNHQHEENENLRLGNLFGGQGSIEAVLTMP